MIGDKLLYIEHFFIESIPIIYVNSGMSMCKNSKNKLIFLFHKLLLNKSDELPLAYLLAMAGYSVVLIDIRGHGERNESFEENSKYNFNFLFKDLYKTAEDIEKVIIYLEKRYSDVLDFDNITSIGVSIGANVAWISGYLFSKIKKVVSIIGGLDWKESVLNGSFQIFRHFSYNENVIDYDLVKDDLENYHPITRYKDMEKLPQCLLLNGKLDLTIPIDTVIRNYNSMLEIYNNKNQEKDILLYQYGAVGHMVNYRMMNDLIMWLHSN